MKAADVQGAIGEFIASKLLHSKSTLEGDTPLYSSGLLNSMAHLKLVKFIESTWDISIPRNQMSIANFDCLDQISDLVVGQILDNT